MVFRSHPAADCQSVDDVDEVVDRIDVESVPLEVFAVEREPGHGIVLCSEREALRAVILQLGHVDVHSVVLAIVEELFPLSEGLRGREDDVEQAVVDLRVRRDREHLADLLAVVDAHEVDHLVLQHLLSVDCQRHVIVRHLHHLK